jgi:hypothetical protein
MAHTLYTMSDSRVELVASMSGGDWLAFHSTSNSSEQGIPYCCGNENFITLVTGARHLALY